MEAKVSSVMSRRHVPEATNESAETESRQAGIKIHQQSSSSPANRNLPFSKIRSSSIDTA